MLRGVGRFVTHRSAVAGATLVLLLVGIAIAGPLLAGDPFRPDIDRGLSALGAPLPPSGTYVLGTDSLGRDVAARIVYGAGTSLLIALAATVLAAVLGIGVGIAAGYAGGRTDTALMRLVDLALAFPYLLLAILLAALLHQADLEARYVPVILPLAALGWTTFARVIRAQALVLARSEYVMAAKSLGASTRRVLARHMLPNLAGTITVVGAFTFAQMLLGEAALSYMGLGPPAPEPTWGRMLYEGRPYYRVAPWLVVAPGVAIVTAVAAFTILGEGLRRWLDPGSRSEVTPR
jgi:peptide/nickel transport system permease protein